MDDMPSPEKCLHAAFVLSSEPLAKITSVDTEAALKSFGAVAYISTPDIPPGGQNLGCKSRLATEKCFADDLVEYVGQQVGLMVRLLLNFWDSVMISLQKTLISNL